MSKSLSNNNDDVLARLAEAFVEQSVPDGPDEDVKRRLLVSLGQAAARPSASPHLRIWKGPVMRKLVSVAAIVLVVLGVAAYTIPQSGKGPGAAFAAMVQRVQEASTAKFRMAVEMKDSPDDAMEADMTFKDPAWALTEMSMGGLKATMIANYDERKVLVLHPDSKQGRLVEMKGGGAQPQQKNFIEAIREMVPDDATYLAEETIEGQSVRKYSYKKKGDCYTVWISAATNLPVRVDSASAEDPANASVRVTLSQFEWDGPVDESKFTLELPSGYQLTGHTVAPGTGSVDDLTKLMHYLAAANEGQFPDELTTMGMITAMQRQAKSMAENSQAKEEFQAAKAAIANALEQPQLAKLSDKEYPAAVMTALQPILGGGVMFMETTKQNHQWNYQGQGVKLGEADKIVLRWHPLVEAAEASVGKLDSGTATVMYGDLRIEQKPVAELPGVGE